MSGKATNLRGYIDILRNEAGEGDEVLVDTRGGLKGWRGKLVKRISDGWLVKGKGGTFRLEVPGNATANLTPARRKYPDMDMSVTGLELDHYYQQSGYDQRTGEFRRGGILYFDIVVQEYYIEEAIEMAEEGDQGAIDNLQEMGIGWPDPNWNADLEGPALKEAAKILGAKISNEGHSGGGLICKIPVADYAEVKRINAAVQRNTTGGDDEIELGWYVVAQGFTLYPDENLANGRAWGNGYGSMEGDLDDWLADFKPGGAPGPKRASEILKKSYNPPLHNAAEADEAVGDAYRKLVDLKLGFDSWEEIPKSAQRLYKEIMGAMSACGKARESTYQVRMMVQRKKYGADDPWGDAFTLSKRMFAVDKKLPSPEAMNWNHNMAHSFYMGSRLRAKRPEKFDAWADAAAKGERFSQASTWIPAIAEVDSRLAHELESAIKRIMKAHGVRWGEARGHNSVRAAVGSADLERAWFGRTAEDVMPQVGDILYSSWGYDQTNIDFYQITKVTPRQVIIEQLQKKVTGGGRGQDKVMPVPGRLDPRGKKLRRKWSEYNGGVSVSINSYSSAYSWDGKPQWQTAAGYGH